MRTPSRGSGAGRASGSEGFIGSPPGRRSGRGGCERAYVPSFGARSGTRGARRRSGAAVGELVLALELGVGLQATAQGGGERGARLARVPGLHASDELGDVLGDRGTLDQGPEEV